MTVFIKDFDIPQACYQCPFCDYEQGNCMAANERHTDATRYDKRMTWCPLEPMVQGHWIVRHGNWEDEYECSICHDISKDGKKYCGNCGADMREE